MRDSYGNIRQGFCVCLRYFRIHVLSNRRFGHGKKVRLGSLGLLPVLRPPMPKLGLAEEAEPTLVDEPPPVNARKASAELLLLPPPVGCAAGGGGLGGGAMAEPPPPLLKLRNASASRALGSASVVCGAPTTFRSV